MPGGAGQRSSDGGGQGRGAGAVTAEPSWAAERPRRCDPGEVGPPSGCRRSPGCPDAGQAGRCPVRLVRSAVGMSVRSSGRPASTRLVSRRPRHPGVRTDTLWCPRRCRRAVCALDPGVARRGGPPRPGQRVDVPRGLWAAWSPACIGPAGKGMARRWPWLARTRVDVAQGRRLAGVPAAAPPWPQRADTGAGPGPGCRPGGGGARDRAGAHQPPQGVLVRSPA
jgi:hypothetical protein